MANIPVTAGRSVCEHRKAALDPQRRDSCAASGPDVFATSGGQHSRHVSLELCSIGRALRLGSVDGRLVGRHGICIASGLVSAWLGLQGFDLGRVFLQQCAIGQDRRIGFDLGLKRFAVRVQLLSSSLYCDQIGSSQLIGGIFDQLRQTLGYAGNPTGMMSPNSARRPRCLV